MEQKLLRIISQGIHYFLFPMSKFIAFEKDLLFYFTKANLIICKHYPSKNTWQFQKFNFDMEFDDRFESISIGRQIYIMGGYQKKDVYQYNIETQSLDPKASMIVAKNCHTLCHIFHKIYSIGGDEGEDSSADCEVYNSRSDEWTKLHNLNSSRWNAAVFQWNNRNIYTIGGYSSKFQKHIKDYEIYDTWGPKIWVTYRIKESSDFEGMHNNYGCQIGPSKALIYGGSRNDKKFYECYEVVKEGRSLAFHLKGRLRVKAEFFFSSAPIINNNILYSVDNKHFIHWYDINNGTWSVESYE